MAEVHKKTFNIRKAWIDNKNQKPMGQEIVERFPRFMDMLEAVRQFLALSIKYLLLISFDKFMINWLPMEAKILKLLPAEAQDDINMSGNSFSVSIFILLVFYCCKQEIQLCKAIGFSLLYQSCCQLWLKNSRAADHFQKPCQSSLFFFLQYVWSLIKFIMSEIF